MSLDIFFFSYLDRKPVPFSIDIVVEAFGTYADRRDRTCWRLKFPDGGWSDLDIDDAVEISDFGLNRPALSPELSRGLLGILVETRGILVCTGAGSCVADPSVIPRIDFADAVSPVYVVDDAEQIRSRIKEALTGAARYTEHVRRVFNERPP